MSHRREHLGHVTVDSGELVISDPENYASHGIRVALPNEDGVYPVFLVRDDEGRPAVLMAYLGESGVVE